MAAATIAPSNKVDQIRVIVLIWLKDIVTIRAGWAEGTELRTISASQWAKIFPSHPSGTVDVTVWTWPVQITPCWGTIVMVLASQWDWGQGQGTSTVAVVVLEKDGVNITPTYLFTILSNYNYRNISIYNKNNIIRSQIMQFICWTITFWWILTTFLY